MHPELRRNATLVSQKGSFLVEHYGTWTLSVKGTGTWVLHGLGSLDSWPRTWGTLVISQTIAGEPNLVAAPFCRLRLLSWTHVIEFLGEFTASREISPQMSSKMTKRKRRSFWVFAIFEASRMFHTLPRLSWSSVLGLLAYFRALTVQTRTIHYIKGFS